MSIKNNEMSDNSWVFKLTMPSQLLNIFQQKNMCENKYLPKVFALLVFISFTASLASQSLHTAIRLNQVGFFPNSQKIGIVPGTASGEFHLYTTDLQKKVFTGTLSDKAPSRLSDKSTRHADFSKFKEIGKYVLVVPGLGHSYPFDIKPAAFLDAAKASLKAFYYQRASVPLLEKHAGKWHRPAGHPDKNVMVHPSAATSERGRGSIIASPGGWYDAGDYNKYIVNSGITMGTLLSLYEDFPDYFNKLETNIPESGNALPDLLDEALWNLRWMLSMQDPQDGGVYHKCTTAEFEGFVKPGEAKAQRYVVQKSTAASLDFAAVTAQAARIFSQFETEVPGLADSCLSAAKKAWEWAAKNPNTVYDQAQLNLQFEPDINTGAYGDGEFSDERIWAACELFVTTKDGSFLQNIELYPVEAITVPNWSDVRTMGYYSLLRHYDDIDQNANRGLPFLKNLYLAFAKGLMYRSEQHAYHAPIEQSAENFVWGSNAVAANQGIALLYAYRLDNDPAFLQAALDNFDYLMGRNATGYCYLTGFGSKAPMHPHHRPSESDGVEDPVPGLLVGGPNPGQQDNCPNYPNKIPDESYIDDVCSYASNEIAINWNAPFVYLGFGLEIWLGKAGK
jgi:endoglucanase